MLPVDSHPWENTQHCLRKMEQNEDGSWSSSCMNDHTGCLYNDGHNGCGAPVLRPFDSPLYHKNNQ